MTKIEEVISISKKNTNPLLYLQNENKTGCTIKYTSDNASADQVQDMRLRISTAKSQKTEYLDKALNI